MAQISTTAVAAQISTTEVAAQISTMAVEVAGQTFHHK
jgi:hypothetical protein